jgi:RNA polymerase sigma-70 factor (ECF subfamily)
MTEATQDGPGVRGVPDDLGALFRHESGRMVSALVRVFGVHNLALAEDAVQDALCRALEVWKFQGVPEKPGAWLMEAARRRAIDVLRKERTRRTFAPDVTRLLETEWTLSSTVQELFSEHEIRDDQLRMMFSCCHPQVAHEGQIALVLNLLCGFGVREIAAAFLTGEAAMEKRLQRAKKTLAESEHLYEVAGEEKIRARIDAVHAALYLLFNEGYHGSHPEHAVRVELCDEAIRLAELLAAHPAAGTPESTALAALMHLHAARLPARVDENGEMLALDDQDRSKWDRAHVARGVELLEASAAGNALSELHVEAAIAAAHAHAPSVDETRWDAIVDLYDVLYRMKPTPIVSLNRAIAVGRRDGAEAGLVALRSIEGRERLDDYPFYAAAIGELELRAGHRDAARASFEQAVTKARTAAERKFLERKVHACG